MPPATPVTNNDPPAITEPPATNSVKAPPTRPINVHDLVAQLGTDDRQAAAVSLASAGKSAVPALLKALDHADWQVRAAAVFALGQIGADAGEAKPKLQSIAERDENASVRDAAAFALDALAESR